MSGKEIAIVQRSGETVEVQVFDVKRGEMVTASMPVELADRFPSYGGVEEMAELSEEVFGESGGSLSVGDLVRVKVPDGNSVAFTVREEPAKHVEGIIIVRQDRRNYWEQSVEEGGNQAPDCYSRDAITGVGQYGVGSEENPLGKCEQCPMSQWLDGPDDARIPPPCHEQVAVLMLVEDMAFPLLITVPRTSIKNFREYWKNTLFMQMMKSLPEVVTRVGLAKTKNAANVAYNELTFTMVEDLTAGMTTAEKRAYKLVPLSLAHEFHKILVQLDTSEDEPSEPSASTGPRRDADPDDPDAGGGFRVTDDAITDEPVAAAV